MDKSKLLSDLFDDKTVSIIKKILNKEDIFYLRDISRESGVSLATTYRIVQKLLRVGLVKKDHLDKFTYYKIEKNTPVFDELLDLFIGKKTDAFDMLRNKIQEKYKNAEIYVIKGSKDKKCFIVGAEISEMFVRETIRDIFDKTSTKINSIVLTKEKFTQMKDMGLITNEKQI